MIVGSLLALACAAVSPLPAQIDSVTVRAGERYAAGGFERMLFGSAYRDLWTTPIRVPVLRTDTFAGGLVPLQRGQSTQTISLRFRAPDGRQFVFRSVDKEQATALPVDFRNTVVSSIAQDLVSAKHPGAALVVSGILEAAGVLHARPQFFVLADHPLLGEYRQDFAGWLGMLEERPDEADDSPGFGGFPRIIGSERLFERVGDSAEDRVDSRAFLKARLVDVLVGDWDRHPDQWRWAEEKRGDTRWWIPIPRDRDNAFSHVEGAVSVLAGAVLPTTMRFESRITELYGFLHNAQVLDRRFLPELPLAVWDSIAHDLQIRISDDAIASAVARLPVEWQPLEAEELGEKLRARRDALPRVARELYRLLLREVDVYGTDTPARVEVERLGGGGVRVRLAPRERPEAVFYDRVFTRDETREVRVHLGSGGNHARVFGRGGGGMTVRIIGGPGDDLLEDVSETTGRAVTAFYAHAGGDRFVITSSTRVDGRAFQPPPPRQGFSENDPPPRDWGGARSWLAPHASWRSLIGPVLGVGPSWTRYGFRRIPYASQTDVRLVYAPLHQRFGIEGDARLLRTGGGGETRFTVRASQLALTRFAGWGNETPEEPAPDLFNVWATEFTLSAILATELGGGSVLSLGPLVELVDPAPVEGGPASAPGVHGAGRYGLGGGRVELSIDRRDSPDYPRRGFHLAGSASGYPLARGDAPEAFARTALIAAAHIPLPGPLQPTLAARAGGERLWGRAPLQHSAFIGGAGTVRGLPRQRYAGEASAFGTLELRTTLGRPDLRVARPELGTIALVDAGRVYVTGLRSELWHSGYGGGIWLGALGRSTNAHLVYVRGEHHALHAGLGLPF